MADILKRRKVTENQKTLTGNNYVSFKNREYTMLDGSKKLLIQQVGDGSVIKRFDKTLPPTTPTDVVCPHFLELKWGYGCPFDCAWCYLKGTFRFLKTKTKPVLRDYEKIEKHVRFFLELYHPPEVLNTGELADSLMSEGTNRPFSKFIVPIFEEQTRPKRKRHKLLFLTKSDNIGNLLKIGEHNQTIVSFSVNASNVSKKWEKGAPSVVKRLDAAKGLSDADYEVRLRIDPMVPIKGWSEKYKKLVDMIFRRFEPERITIGSLRGLQSTINNAEDKSWVSYLKDWSNWGRKIPFNQRFELYQTVLNYLKDSYSYKNVGFCKETLGMWKSLGLKYKKIKCNCIL